MLKKLATTSPIAILTSIIITAGIAPNLKVLVIMPEIVAATTISIAIKHPLGKGSETGTDFSSFFRFEKTVFFPD